MCVDFECTISGHTDERPFGLIKSRFQSPVSNRKRIAPRANVIFTLNAHDSREWPIVCPLTCTSITSVMNFFPRNTEMRWRRAHIQYFISNAHTTVSNSFHISIDTKRTRTHSFQTLLPPISFHAHICIRISYFHPIWVPLHHSIHHKPKRIVMKWNSDERTFFICSYWLIDNISFPDSYASKLLGNFMKLFIASSMNCQNQLNLYIMQYEAIL